MNTPTTSPWRTLLRWTLTIPLVAVLGLLALTTTAQAAEPGSGYGPPAPGGGTLSFPTVVTAMTVGTDGGVLQGSVGCTEYGIAIPPGFLDGGAQVVLAEAPKEQAQGSLPAALSGYEVAQAVQISRRPVAPAASQATVPPGLRGGGYAVRAATAAPDGPSMRITGCYLDAGGTKLLVWSGNAQRLVVPGDGQATIDLTESVTSVLILVPKTEVLGTSAAVAPASTATTVASEDVQGSAPDLSYTGTKVTSLLPIGAGGLLAGAALMVLARRRRKAE